MNEPVPFEIARQELCRFLAACYYEPSADFAEADLFGSMQAVARVLGSEFHQHAVRLGQAFAADDLQTLLVDHTRLFIGPSRPLATPYGSFWLSADGALMQDSTFAVVDLYREGGFDLDETFRDLPDHVAVELEFLYLLLFQHRQAVAHGDEAEAARIDLLRRRLLQDHLVRWLAPFTAAIAAQAETLFYRELAELTARFVRSL